MNTLILNILRAGLLTLFLFMGTVMVQAQIQEPIRVELSIPVAVENIHPLTTRIGYACTFPTNNFGATTWKYRHIGALLNETGVFRSSYTFTFSEEIPAFFKGREVPYTCKFTSISLEGVTGVCDPDLVYDESHRCHEALTFSDDAVLSVEGTYVPPEGN